jgi:ribosomal protein L23
VEARALWVANQQGSPEVRLNLEFNYKVNPADVANLTNLTVDNKAVTFKVDKTEVSPTIQLAIANIPNVKFDGKTA